jgi:hypothetical protein
MAKSVGYQASPAASRPPVCRRNASLTRVAIAAIFVGVFAIELVAIGASLLAMLPQDVGRPVNGTR